MIFPPESYWPEIQRICRKYDVLLCADEVIGGFGRTGEWFAHQYFGFEPDTLSIAKGLTSGYVPMGGLVLSKRMAEVLVEKGGVFAHGLTYSGHPVAAAVAIANLKALRDENRVTTVRDDTGPYLQKTLREVFSHHPMIGEIRAQASWPLCSSPKISRPANALRMKTIWPGAAGLSALKRGHYPLYAGAYDYGSRADCQPQRTG